ncbi:MAG: rubrerythrin family protein [Candidatus Acetothermia bacterium]
MREVSEMTKSHLRNAFSGESQANMRYQIYSEVAENEGFPNVARLFGAISYAERVHATNHLRRSPEEDGNAVAEAPYGVGSTAENLQKGIDGETFEIEEMYPTYLEVAKFQGEGAAKKSFEWALAAEKTHAEMFKSAKKTVEKGEDPEMDDLQVCSVCGHTVEGEAPDVCPICETEDNYLTFD